MTTMLTPPESNVAPAAPPRLLSIAANLLPPETIQARTTRKVRRAVIASLVVLIVALGGWYAYARVQVAGARADLSLAQADVTRVKRLQNQYSDLTRTQAESASIRAQLAQLFASDVQWSQLLTAIESTAAAKKIQFDGATGADTTPGGAAGTGAAAGAAAGAATGAGAAQPANPNVLHTLSITGAAATKADVSTYLDALSAIPGLANARLDDATYSDQRRAFEFTVRVDVTKDAINGRFTTKQSGDK
jgi:hypothetical protein